LKNNKYNEEHFAHIITWGATTTDLPLTEMNAISLRTSGAEKPVKFIVGILAEHTIHGRGRKKVRPSNFVIRLGTPIALVKTHFCFLTLNQ